MIAPGIIAVAMLLLSAIAFAAGLKLGRRAGVTDALHLIICTRIEPNLTAYHQFQVTVAGALALRDQT